MCQNTIPKYSMLHMIPKEAYECCSYFFQYVGLPWIPKNLRNMIGMWVIAGIIFTLYNKEFRLLGIFVHQVNQDDVLNTVNQLYLLWIV